MENYGDSWMFFFQVWTKLSSSGDAKTHKLPTTCTLSRLLPERSRSVTSHHARNFTNCSASQFLCKSAQLLKDFSRNHPIVKPIPFPILIGVVFGNGGLTIGGVPEKIPCNLPNKLRVDAAIYTSEFFYQNSAFARPDMRRFGSQNASVLSLEPQDCKQGLDLNTQTTRQVTKQRTKMQIDMKTTHRKWMMHLGLTIDSPRFFFGAGRLTSLTASASAWHSSNSKVLKLRSLPLQLTTQWLKIQPVKLFKA